eukprot:ctg_675.g331
MTVPRLPTDGSALSPTGALATRPTSSVLALRFPTPNYAGGSLQHRVCAVEVDEPVLPPDQHHPRDGRGAAVGGGVAGVERPEPDATTNGVAGVEGGREGAAVAQGA